MINFTVGPVQMDESICNIGSEQVPYFRTDDFSELMKENEKMLLSLADADYDGRAVFITGSGTASMEAAVINTLDESDNAIIINGGSFGSRFVDICKVHGIRYSEVKLNYGKKLTLDQLVSINVKDYTAFIVNIHETSTGVHYDLNMIADFCKKNGLFLIVDAISSFLADDISMREHSIDVLITGSQKALACPPGVSMIMMSSRACERVRKSKRKCVYLDIKEALSNGDRGQTPFTPAVSILRQLNFRMRSIVQNGGAQTEIKRVSMLANDFRDRLVDLPFSLFAESPSNAVTALLTSCISAYDVFTILKNEYGIWVCPNGGELKERVFRVGHIGALTIADNSVLLEAFSSMRKRGLFEEH